MGHHHVKYAAVNYFVKNFKRAREKANYIVALKLFKAYTEN